MEWVWSQGKSFKQLYKEKCKKEMHQTVTIGLGIIESMHID